MKVTVSSKRPDVYVGDIILFNNMPCMVIDMGEYSDEYGILSLDEVGGGEVIARFGGLSAIDMDSRTGKVLIERKDIIISSKEEGVAECPF